MLGPAQGAGRHGRRVRKSCIEWHKRVVRCFGHELANRAAPLDLPLKRLAQHLAIELREGGIDLLGLVYLTQK